MKHLEQCIAIHELSQQAQTAWQTRNPHYCQNCDGNGQFISRFDPSPSGVSLGGGYMTDVEPCNVCVENGLCPRCGKEGLGEELPCLFCGWDFDKNIDPMPENSECQCFMGID